MQLPMTMGRLKIYYLPELYVELAGLVILLIYISHVNSVG